MISKEQYYREASIEKKGFWLGVRIMLLVVVVIGMIVLVMNMN